MKWIKETSANYIFKTWNRSVFQFLNFKVNFLSFPKSTFRWNLWNFKILLLPVVTSLARWFIVEWPSTMNYPSFSGYLIAKSLHVQLLIQFDCRYAGPTWTINCLSLSRSRMETHASHMAQPWTEKDGKKRRRRRGRNSSSNSDDDEYRLSQCKTSKKSAVVARWAVRSQYCGCWYTVANIASAVWFVVSIKPNKELFC